MRKMWCVEIILTTLDSYTMLNLSICVSDLYRAKVKLAYFEFYKSEWFNEEYFILISVDPQRVFGEVEEDLEDGNGFFFVKRN